MHTVSAEVGENCTVATLDDFICRLGILGDCGGDGPVDWRDGAGFIRDHLPNAVPLHVHRVNATALKEDSRNSFYRGSPGTLCDRNVTLNLLSILRPGERPGPDVRHLSIMGFRHPNDFLPVLGGPLQ
jgi:hypothetical protein